ncbi:hypothetical protein NITLEN_10217 [Nitrospira lenta]|uniref:Uncharacterized protein n=1 Tax=Nitrospira lenta TaxID=1436998 RepID=A0A330L017_9BACT|nr:hypothetical protein NITLEN_10217 [Nitrospira lenta]
MCASTDRVAGAIDPILIGHISVASAKLLSLWRKHMLLHGLLMERSKACPLLILLT